MTSYSKRLKLRFLLATACAVGGLLTHTAAVAGNKWRMGRTSVSELDTQEKADFGCST